MRLSHALIVVVVSGVAAGAVPAAREAAQVQPDPSFGLGRIDPWVVATGATGPTEFLVFLNEQADLRGADLLTSKAAKGRYVFDRLTDTASRTQRPLLDLL